MRLLYKCAILSQVSFWDYSVWKHTSKLFNELQRKLLKNKQGAFIRAAVQTPTPLPLPPPPPYTGDAQNAWKLCVMCEKMYDIMWKNHCEQCFTGKEGDSEQYHKGIWRGQLALNIARYIRLRITVIVEMKKHSNNYAKNILSILKFVSFWLHNAGLSSVTKLKFMQQ